MAVLAFEQGWTAVVVPRQETFELFDFEPSVSGSLGGLDVLSTRGPGNYDLAVRQKESFQLSVITNTGWDERRPSVWPGRGILAVANRDRALGQVVLVRRAGIIKRLLGKPYVQIFFPLSSTMASLDELLAAWGRPASREYAISVMSESGPRIERLGPKAKLISQYMGARAASYSPDGLALCLDRGGNIVLIDLGSKTETDLTSGPALDLFPSFSQDGTRILFRRYDQDTDGNGTVDIRDLPLLAAFDMNTGRVIPLAPRTRSYQDAVYAAGDRILYSEENSEGIRTLFSLPRDGIFMLGNHTLEALQIAGRSENVAVAEIALERLAQEALLDSVVWANALLGRAALYKRGNNLSQAAYVLEQILRSRASRESLLEAELEFEMLNGPKQAQRSRLVRLGEEAQGFQNLHGKILLAIAASHEAWDQLEEALGAARAAEEIAQDPEIRVQAWKDISQIARKLGLSGDEAAALIKILGSPADPDLIRWSSEALLKWASRKSGSLPDLETCQDLLEKYLDLPQFRGRIQFRVGQILEKLGDSSQAAREYMKIEKVAGGPTLWAVEGNLAASRIHKAEGRRIAAIEDLEAAGDRTHRKLLIELRKLLHAQLEEDLEGRRYSRAEKMARKGILVDPDEPLFHRGLIQAKEAMGQILYAVGEYEAAIEKDPKRPSLRYGLAYSYTSPAHDKPYLRRAAKQLRIALDQDPYYLYAYLTLGWITEQDAKTRAVAVDLYKKGLALTPPNENVLRGSFLLNLANALMRLGGGRTEAPKNVDQAILYYQRRLRLNVPYENPEQEAFLYYNLGRAESLLGDYKPSREHLLRARKYFERKERKDFAFEIANRLHSVAFKRALAEEVGSLEEAWTEGMKALEYAKQLNLGEDQVRLLRQLCGTALMLKKPEESLALGREALSRTKEIKKKGGGSLFSIKIDFPVLDDDPTQAAQGFDSRHTERILHTWMAQAAKMLPDYRLAYQHLLSNLRLHEGRKEQPGLLSILQNNLGDLAYERGYLGDAAAHYQKARDLAEEVESVLGITVNSTNLALVQAMMKIHEASDLGWWGRVSDDSAMQALQVLKNEAQRTQNPVLFNAASALAIALGHARTAGSLAERGLEVADDVESRSILKLHQALSLAARGYLDLADTSLESTAKLLGDEGLPTLEFEIEKARGYVANLSGKTDQAINHLKRAMEITELMPMAISGSQRQIFTDQSAVHRKLIRSLLSRERTSEAFDLLERLRAQKLAARFPPRKLKLGNSSDTKALARVRDMQEEISTLSRRLRELRQDTLVRPEIITDLRKMIGDRRSVYEDKLFELRNTNPMVAAMVAVHPATAYDVQYLLGPGEALLSFFVEGDGSYGFLVTSKDLIVKKLDTPRKAIRQLVGKARQTSAWAKEPPAELAELGKKLVEPFWEEMREIQTLYIVPDDHLFYVPWSAMRIQGKYLCQWTTLIQVPSARALDFAVSKLSLARVGLLVSSLSTRTDELLPPRNIVPGQRKSFTGSLKPEDFLKLAPKYGVLHLSHPLYVESGSPYRSSIGLGSGDSGKLLRVEDLLSLSASASLLVLPQGRIHPAERGAGDEIAALVGASIYAGIPTILMAQEVPEKGAEDFIRKFYKDRDELGAAKALQHAQQTAIDKGIRPGVWAFFQIWGFPDLNREQRRELAAWKAKESSNEAIRLARKGNLGVASQKAEVSADLYSLISESELAVRAKSMAMNMARQGGDLGKAISLARGLAEDYKKIGNDEQEIWVRIGLGEMILQSGGRAESRKILEEAFQDSKKMENQDLIRASRASLKAALVATRELASAVSLQLEVLNSGEGKNEPGLRIEGLVELGALLALDERHQEALEPLELALGLMDSLDRGEIPKILSATLHKQLGFVHSSLGNFDSSSDHLEKAMGFLSANDPKLQASRAEVILRQAVLAFVGGDLEKARMRLRKARSAAATIGSIALEIQIENLAGIIALNVGQYDEATLAFESSLKLARQKGMRSEEPNLLSNLALVARTRGEMSKAQDLLLEALVIDEELGSDSGRSDDLRQLAILSLAEGKMNEARKQFRQSLDLAKKASNRRLVIRCQLGLAEVEMDRENYKESAKLFGRALQGAEEAGLADEIWRALYGQGRAARSMGQASKAAALFSQAVRKVEAQRAQLRVEEFRAGFLEGKMDLYEDWVLAFAEANDAEGAVDALERSKARGFLDLLSGRKIDVEDPAASALLGNIEKLKNELAIAQVPNSQEEDESPSQKEARQIRVNGLRDAYEGLLLQVKKDYPELTGLVTVDPVKAAEFSSSLRTDEAVLAFALLEKQSLVFVVRQQGLTFFRLDVTALEVEERVRRVRETIAAGEDSSVDLRWLGANLIEPALPGLEGTKILGLIPHKSLHYLPFAAVEILGQPLIEKWPLYLAPSLSVLDVCKKRPRRGGKKLLAISNPSLGAAFDLPFALREVRAIETAGFLVEKYTLAEATESVFRSKTPPSYLHFACHGEFLPDNPLFSGLLLGPGGGHDGRLEAHEILEMKILSDLVVLSACQTGLARVTTGDEITGLDRAFVTAGARTILSSLWRVNDLTTAVLIKRFYRHLSQSNPVLALQKAMLEIRKAYPHPSLWAGLKLTGAPF